ncbi:MAG: CPBP family intramembrane metalloprotease [Mariniphaga sp.]|nr:CPBP family intramembrane metalloprotease [Mariniphaga sp.]
MAFTAFRDTHPFSQFVLSIFIIIVCFILFLVGSIILAIPLFGLDSISAIPTLDNLTNPDSIRILKYFQVVQSIGLFIIPPFIIAWLFKGQIAEYLLLNKKITGIGVVLVILLIFFANPAINYIGSLNTRMVFPSWLSWMEEWMRSAEDKAAVLTEAFLDVKTIPGLMFNLFMIAFLPAIGEELVFRGVIQKIFTDWTKNAHLGIWISAIIFSAFHLQFYGFMPRLLLGVLFGYLLVWSGSMWLPIIAHFVNNAAAVIAMWMVSQDKIDPAIEEIGATSESLYIAVISFFMSIALLFLIKSHKKFQKTS